jgi:YegS/Rv2252/BmrU family lipid kinase
MQRRLLYIINPVSGTKNKQPLQEIIKAKTAAAGFPFKIFPSVADGDYSFLDDVIKEEKFTDVIVAGGDGTINQSIAGLKKHRVQFGIIPCGSGNGLAFSAGIPKNPEKALDIIFRGRSAPTDAFLINNQFACMLCGLGFDAQVAHDFALDKKRGLTTYVKKVVQNFFKAPIYPFVLKLGENTLQPDAYFISIANSNQFGNNFTIAPKASLTDGLLDVVIMMRQNKLNMLLQTLRQISGYNKLQKVEMLDDQTSILYFQAKNIFIANPQLAPMHLDGEPIESAATIEIKILPESFQLIFPE